MVVLIVLHLTIGYPNSISAIQVFQKNQVN
jgi:hypothetical protein